VSLSAILGHHHTHICFSALWILSGTSWVSQYQKKHSPKTLMVINHPLSASSIYYDPWHPLPAPFTCLAVFFLNLSPSFLWSTSWPSTLQFILHTFLHQSLSSFRSTCPYLHNLFCCSTEIMSSNPSLSLIPIL